MEGPKLGRGCEIWLEAGVMCVTQIQTGPALQYWSHPVPLGAPHNLEESATRLQVPKVEPQRGKELQYMNGNCPYFPPQSTWTPGA